MKLIECYVSSFGNLKDFSYKFNETLNIINEQNGFGKTTLTYFIKAMFYGLANDSKHSLEDNERKRFKPWNSTQVFGGYLIFEKEQKLYKIQRFFGSKASEDQSVLTELSTGKTFENPGDIGSKLFEIDEQGYVSTTFFSQKDISVKSNYSLTAKFNDICSVQDDTDFSSALTLVKNKIKSYKYSGQRGLIPQTQNDIFDLERNIRALERSASEIDALTEEKNLLKDQLSSLSSQTKKLTERLSVAAEKEAFNKNKAVYDNLVSELVNLKEKKVKILSSLNNFVPSEQELLACKNCIDDFQKIKVQEERLSADIEKLGELINESKTKTKKRKIAYIPLFGSIAFLVGIGMLFVNHLVATILMCIGALVDVVSLFVPKKQNSSENSIQEIYNEKLNEQMELKNMLKGYFDSISEFLSKFNLTFEDPYVKLEEVNKKIVELDLIDREIASKEQSVAQFDFDKKTHDVKDEDLTVIQLREVLSQDNEKINSLSAKLIKIESLLKDKDNDLQSIDYLSTKLADLKESLISYQKDYKVLLLTQEYLEKAEENLKTRYREPLQSAFNRYLDTVTNSLKKADIDIDFNVKINENGSSQPVEYYSQGYKDIFDICKRFALIDVLFAKEKPFLILDDPFCNLDEDKLRLALNLLKETSKTYQILYFSCHDSRVI